MSGEPPYPEYDDPMGKFKPSPGPCETGAEVFDSATRFDGKQVCSSCRGEMEVSGSTWVHASRKQ